ncbi:MAG: protease inhibitor I42 family protein [Microthrixaceae bacterium]
MRTRLIALALCLPVAAVAVGCSSSSDSTTTTTASGSSTTTADGGSGGGGVTVTEPGPVSLKPGEQATIILESNPTTGYSWELTSAPDTAVVRVVSDTYVPPAEQMPGAGGKQEILIEGVGAGTATLEFGYRRPWETDVPPTETAAFPVTVS